MLEKIKFIEEFKKSFKEDIFIKVLISKPTDKKNKIKNISIRLVDISGETRISFLFRYFFKDITKNISFDQALIELKNIIGIDFKNSVLFTKNNDITISYNNKMNPKIIRTKATGKSTLSTDHNKKKPLLIDLKNSIYLKELGILSEKGEIIKKKQSKFKQINKYIETLDSIIKKSDLKKEGEISIIDMGSGKGYLTFAIYDFLKNTSNLDIKVIGVEMRENLVELCNSISDKCDFDKLSFIHNNIQNFQYDKIDILIALHACDTATDDAIFKGIISNSEIIITSPCCHKQIRKELDSENELNSILKYGILKERQAELVTDTMRGLVLEAYGYKTQIFEFITDGHTHKNIMIVGVKSKNPLKDIKAKSFEKIKDLKKIFGINSFYLEEILKN